MGLFAEGKANYVLSVRTKENERLTFKRTSRETGESDAVELQHPCERPSGSRTGGVSAGNSSRAKRVSVNA